IWALLRRCWSPRCIGATAASAGINALLSSWPLFAAFGGPALTLVVYCHRHLGLHSRHLGNNLKQRS
ncbi:hypothetical protein ACFSQT_32895, partial [Mesorhizobium calcicola]